MIIGGFPVHIPVLNGHGIGNSENGFIKIKAVKGPLNTDLFDQGIVMDPADNDPVVFSCK